MYRPDDSMRGKSGDVTKAIQ